MEQVQAQIWKDMGIYDLIMLSKTGLAYCPLMLVASQYFWDITHFTFHLPCGMVTPTLFDIAVITGLRPTSDYLDPEDLSEDPIGFSAMNPTYTVFINHFHDKLSTTFSEGDKTLRRGVNIFLFFFFLKA